MAYFERGNHKCYWIFPWLCLRAQHLRRRDEFIEYRAKYNTLKSRQKLVDVFYPPAKVDHKSCRIVSITDCVQEKCSTKKRSTKKCSTQTHKARTKKRKRATSKSIVATPTPAICIEYDYDYEEERPDFESLQYRVLHYGVEKFDEHKTDEYSMAKIRVHTKRLEFDQSARSHVITIRSDGKLWTKQLQEANAKMALSELWDFEKGRAYEWMRLSKRQATNPNRSKWSNGHTSLTLWSVPCATSSRSTLI